MKLLQIKNRANRVLLLLMLFAFFSCINSRNRDYKQPLTSFENEKLNVLKLDMNSNEILKTWFNYYQSHTNNFSLDSFIFEERETIHEMQGTVCGTFDKCFDSRLADFLIYSPSKKSYIDFDSYGMILDENNAANFDVDQETKKQTMTRILFYEPSQWVEDAFWENDSTVVLLENSSDQIPPIQIINLNTKKRKHYIYKDTLDFNSGYSVQRLRKKGIKL